MGNITTKDQRMVWFSAAYSETLYHKRKTPAEITSGMFIDKQVLRSFLSFSLISLSKKLLSSDILQCLVVQVSSWKLLGRSNFNIVLNLLDMRKYVRKLEDWSRVVILLLGAWKEVVIKRCFSEKKQMGKETGSRNKKVKVLIGGLGDG